MTEHSAQHMFLLRPLLPRGLFDPSEFPVNLTARHTLEALALSLRPSLREKQEGEEHQKTPSDVEK